MAALAVRLQCSGVGGKVMHTRWSWRAMPVLGLFLLVACSGPAQRWAQPPASRCRPEGAIVDYFVSQRLDDVVKSAGTIVVGRVVKEIGSWNLMRNVQDIQQEAEEVAPGTDYEVTVQRYLRGQGEQAIHVTQAGGTYKNCTETATAEEFQIGQQYVFFLRKSRVGDRYVLSALPGHWRVDGLELIPARVRVGPTSIQPTTFDDLERTIQRIAPEPGPGVLGPPLSSDQRSRRSSTIRLS